VGTPDVGPGLRQGLEALEHSAVAIRSMFRALVDAAQDASWHDEETTRFVLLGLAQTFHEMAAGIDAFGQLVHDEAGPAQLLTAAHVQAHREALDGLHEARARLNDLLVSDPVPDLLELNVAVLSTVKRLLRELDLAERIRRQIRLLGPTRKRVPHAGPLRPGSRPQRPEKEPAPEAETQPLPRMSAEEPEPDGPDRQG
jgi:hypothetical protein